MIECSAGLLCLITDYLYGADDDSFSFARQLQDMLHDNEQKTLLRAC